MTEPSLEQQEKWMRHAYQLAEASVKSGNHPFGACLVLDGEIIFEAQNSVHSDGDPTRHAEMNLIQKASSLTKDKLNRAILVTSTEPCAMCSAGMYWAGIKRVIYGCAAADLDRIAGPSLKCHSHDVFEGAVNPPQVIGPVLPEEGVKQHVAYWPMLQAEEGHTQAHE
ncbi:MAG: nucleoside deaminase [Opitutales bacterium]